MRALRSLSLLALILSVAAPADAQEKICLSVHGGPASGRNKDGGWPSNIRATIRIGGAIDTTGTDIPNDATAEQVSGWHKAEFDSKGYTTCRTNPNEFCILAGPGGAPLQSHDYGYETTDTALRTDIRIEALNDSAAGGCPGPGGAISPGTKSQGVGVTVPHATQPPLPGLPRPVTLMYVITMRDPCTGLTSTTTVTVPVWTDWPGQVIAGFQQQGFQSQGMHATSVFWPSVTHPGTLQPGLLIDRSASGLPVHHVEIRSDMLSHWLMPMEMIAGTVPVYGATEFGQGTRGHAACEPYAAIDRSPQIGGTFQLEYHTGLANAPGGEAMALGRAAQPVPVLNGWLLVDPASTVFTFLLADGNGVMRRSQTVPALANLVGLPLAFQGGAHDASFTLSLTSGITAVLMP